MAIQAAPVNPQKVPLDIDPDQESWVYVLPTTPQIDLARGELLKLQEFDTSGFFTRVIVNPVVLRNTELWLSSTASDKSIEHLHPGHIVIVRASEGEDEDEEPKVVTYLDFIPEGGWTRSKFYEELEKIPPTVLLSWSRAVHTINRDWLLPFA